MLMVEITLPAALRVWVCEVKCAGSRLLHPSMPTVVFRAQGSCPSRMFRMPCRRHERSDDVTVLPHDPLRHGRVDGQQVGVEVVGVDRRLDVLEGAIEEISRIGQPAHLQVVGLCRTFRNG